MIECIQNASVILNKRKDKVPQYLFKKDYEQLNDHEKGETLIQLNNKRI